MVLSIIWLAFWIYWLVSALRTRSQSKRRESFTSRWLYWIVLAVAYGLLLAWLPPRYGMLTWRFLPNTVLFVWVGIAITLLGLGFAVWARVHLGQYWSGRVTIKAGHKLIQTGPYRIVRHPIYTGILLGLVGSAIAVGEVRALMAIVLAAVGIFFKIRVEEKFLLEEFGPAYLQYKKEVKTIIPFVL